jgi:hypothetical protein
VRGSGRRGEVFSAASRERLYLWPRTQNEAVQPLGAGRRAAAALRHQTLHPTSAVWPPALRVRIL